MSEVRRLRAKCKQMRRDMKDNEVKDWAIYIWKKAWRTYNLGRCRRFGSFMQELSANWVVQRRFWRTPSHRRCKGLKWLVQEVSSNEVVRCSAEEPKAFKSSSTCRTIGYRNESIAAETLQNELIHAVRFRFWAWPRPSTRSSNRCTG